MAQTHRDGTDRMRASSPGRMSLLLASLLAVATLVRCGGDRPLVPEDWDDAEVLDDTVPPEPFGSISPVAVSEVTPAVVGICHTRLRVSPLDAPPRYKVARKTLEFSEEALAEAGGATRSLVYNKNPLRGVGPTHSARCLIPDSDLALQEAIDVFSGRTAADPSPQPDDAVEARTDTSFAGLELPG